VPDFFSKGHLVARLDGDLRVRHHAPELQSIKSAPSALSNFASAMLSSICQPPSFQSIAEMRTASGR